MVRKKITTEDVNLALAPRGIAIKFIEEIINDRK